MQLLTVLGLPAITAPSPTAASLVFSLKVDSVTIAVSPTIIQLPVSITPILLHVFQVFTLIMVFALLAAMSARLGSPVMM